MIQQSVYRTSTKFFDVLGAIEEIETEFVIGYNTKYDKFYSLFLRTSRYTVLKEITSKDRRSRQTRKDRRTAVAKA